MPFDSKETPIVTPLLIEWDPLPAQPIVFCIRKKKYKFDVPKQIS